RVDDVGGGEQAGEMDPADDFAGFGIDAGDAVGLPDVGEELAFDPLQLIEVLDRFAFVSDSEAVFFFERVRVPYADLRGAVVHVDDLAVGGHGPALAGILEAALFVEGGEVIDEPEFGSIREL